MNIVFTPTDGITSRFIQEEYIPLTVSLNDKDYVKHIGFYYGDTDLCEFGIDPETNEIIKFVLTCSSHYEFINDKMTVKKGENGLIKLMLPPRIDCSDFKVSVYSDGVHISLSNTTSDITYSSGHLVLRIDNNECISDVYIIGLTKSDIDFIQNELRLG